MKGKEISNPIANTAVRITKAVIIAMLVSLAGILIMAFVIQTLSVDAGIIPVVNQIIKGTAILAGCFVALGRTKNGAFKGLAIGLIYIAVAYIMFSLLDGTWNVGLSLLNDVVLGAVTGFISGIITVNVRKAR